MMLDASPRPRSKRRPSAAHRSFWLRGEPAMLGACPSPTDDWPDPLPVTQAEIDLFEAWFGDVFDELFGPSQ